MQELNNFDIVILIVVAISAIIALSRGLIKEVLSIIGWVFAVVAVIYLLPLLTPYAGQYIESPAMAAVVSAFCIVILFFIIWILLTANLIGKVRKSKLSTLDRVLGLFFGVFRAFLLVILFYILSNWMVPFEKQSEVLKKSKYYNLAGTFAKPIEQLIPQDTLEKIQEKTKAVQLDDAKETESEDESSKNLFELLTQPKVSNKKPILVIDNTAANKAVEARKKAEKEQKAAEEKGYNDNERGNLDRLIENTAE